MTKIKVPVDMVKIGPKEIIKAALPEGFYLTGSGPRFEVRSQIQNQMLVAWAIVRNGGIEIEPNSLTKDELKSALSQGLIKKFPGIDPERLVWRVFYKWYGKFTHETGYYETRGEALASLNKFIVEHGAYLCSFKAKFIGRQRFATETAVPINGDFSLGKKLGSMVIDISTLEYLEKTPPNGGV